jgi:hypothetical protein
MHEHVRSGVNPSQPFSTSDRGSFVSGVIPTQFLHHVTVDGGGKGSTVTRNRLRADLRGRLVGRGEMEPAMWGSPRSALQIGLPTAEMTRDSSTDHTQDVLIRATDSWHGACSGDAK